MGNLSQAVLPNNTVIGYTYDASNRRIAKKVNGVITERFLYKDQLEPVAKIDGNGDILELYIYGEKGHVPGYIVKGGQTYRVISDHLGSVRMIVNANTGDIAQEITYNEFDSEFIIAQEITYNEFGIVLTDTNPGFQPFYFAGGIYDLDTQLVKFGARDYDSETGRWISKEPLGFAGSNNFYSYVNGDPVNFVDPSGLKPMEHYYNFEKLIMDASSDTYLAAGGKNMNYEWAALLFSGTDTLGKKYWFYESPYTGILEDGKWIKSTERNKLEVTVVWPEKMHAIGYVHTHPDIEKIYPGVTGNNLISPGDLRIINQWNHIKYVYAIRHEMFENGHPAVIDEAKYNSKILEAEVITTKWCLR